MINHLVDPHFTGQKDRHMFAGCSEVLGAVGRSSQLSPTPKGSTILKKSHAVPDLLTVFGHVAQVAQLT
jgi:hypothetical protein